VGTSEARNALLEAGSAGIMGVLIFKSRHVVAREESCSLSRARHFDRAAPEAVEGAPYGDVSLLG
jgi:hypothetical protein